jgi:hypothetical protein
MNTNTIEKFFKKIEIILVNHQVNIDDPYKNKLDHLSNVRETIIQEYKENLITRGEYFRTLFEINKITRKIAYG